ncbi:hypothetical protein BDW59DRAFT_51945 [Aspergillus cavernicola]|uniref:Uncharacterized protein n=1 Tax=Aspergillus cavernicola TaxID=176166 RepID=A0ABR4IKF0_9EURO
MEKAHGAVFCLHISRIGTQGLAFYSNGLISDFPGLRVYFPFDLFCLSYFLFSIFLSLSWIPVVLGYLETAQR